LVERVIAPLRGDFYECFFQDVSCEVVAARWDGYLEFDVGRPVALRGMTDSSWRLLSFVPGLEEPTSPSWPVVPRRTSALQVGAVRLALGVSLPAG
jgi:hypothetical protein